MLRANVTANVCKDLLKISGKILFLNYLDSPPEICFNRNFCISELLFNIFF
jgi:hypothetical protein